MKSWSNFSLVLFGKVSGKVLDGGPCTPFDPAPLGLTLHEAQGEELVSTPVFITAGRKVSPLLGLLLSGSRAHLTCSGTLGLFILPANSHYRDRVQLVPKKPWLIKSSA